MPLQSVSKSTHFSFPQHFSPCPLITGITAENIQEKSQLNQKRAMEQFNILSLYATSSKLHLETIVTALYLLMTITSICCDLCSSSFSTGFLFRLDFHVSSQIHADILAHSVLNEFLDYFLWSGPLSFPTSTISSLPSSFHSYYSSPFTDPHGSPKCGRN